MKDLPIELIYGVVAIAGGIARYLNGYVNGQRFKLSVFFASAFVAAFSGLMFALMGESLNMPQQVIHLMAGCGGFFGEQTMKFIMEWLGKRAQ